MLRIAVVIVLGIVMMSLVGCGGGTVSEPAAEVTEEPTVEATEEPTAEATEEPTAEATEEPMPEATEEPTAEATEEPMPEATEELTAEATEEPMPEATEEPTAEATEEPMPEATEEPIDHAANALEVARAWVEANAGELEAAAVESVKESQVMADYLDKVPSLLAGAASALVTEALNAQVEEGLSFEFSATVPNTEWTFVVTVSTTFEGEIDFPVLGITNYRATVPVDIAVNAADREVEEWGLGTATVELEPSSE